MSLAICPNCGGENDVTNRGGQECDFCGTMLQFPKAKAKRDKQSDENNDCAFPIAEYILKIPSEYSTYEEIVEALRRFLINNDEVPIDIFDYLEIKDVKWIYLPMIRYSGRVSTEWSCNQVITKQREIGQRPVRDNKGNIKYYKTEYEYYNEYIPKSGKGFGGFDILVPCAENFKPSKGLDDCYGSIDFSNVSKAIIEKWPCKHVTPENAEIHSDYVALNNNEGILKHVNFEIEWTAERCSFGNFGQITDKDMTYSWNLNNRTGELYYVPFVQVTYAYKGATHEWVFQLSPSVRTAEPTIPKMDINENPLVEMQRQFETKRKRISKREMWSFCISFFIPPFLGLFFFYMFTHKYSDKAKRRLNTQHDLSKLLFRLKRNKSLSEDSNTDEKIIVKGLQKLYNSYYDDDDDVDDELLYDNGEKPSTIKGIEDYFAETEVLYRKAIRRINGYWWRFLGIILLIGALIGGYNYYDHLQNEKVWAEQCALWEAEYKKATEEVTKKFNAEMIGNEYEGKGGDWTKKYIKIKILDDSNLQYRLGEETLEWDANYRNHIIKWGNTKVVPYNLIIRSDSTSYGKIKNYCVIQFDGYKSSDIVSEYGNNFFVSDFTIPINKTQNNTSYSDLYHLKKIK